MEDMFVGVLMGDCIVSRCFRLWKQLKDSTDALLPVSSAFKERDILES